MTWGELRSQRRVRPHKVTRGELDELRAAIAVKLNDARSTSISDDTRFTTAYGAALLIAKMAIACAGYRLDPKTGGHHRTAFEALPLAVGRKAKKLSGYFDICRRKRNEIDDDRPHVASRADANEIINRAEELESLVEDWITTNHASLAKT